MFRFRTFQNGYSSDLVGVTILGGETPGDRYTTGPSIADDPGAFDNDNVRFFGDTLLNQASDIWSESYTREGGVLGRIVSEARTSSLFTGTTPETWSPLASFKRGDLDDLRTSLISSAESPDTSTLSVDDGDPRQ
jgi:hypothetical protein